MVCYRRPIKGGIRATTMNKRLLLAATIMLASPAAAQFRGSTGEDFVDAVRDRDGDKATEILRDRKGTIINARDLKGDTGLVVALQRKDPNWVGFLLREGADPNQATSKGETPLTTAARVGFVDAAQWLIDLGAKVNGANRMGETPLIIAVQLRDTAMVRYLMARGADPKKTDSVAGLSALDYAKRDNRSRDILALLEAATPPKKEIKKVEKLDDFKLQ